MTNLPSDTAAAKATRTFLGVCVSAGLLNYWWTGEPYTCGLMLVAAFLVLMAANRLGT